MVKLGLGLNIFYGHQCNYLEYVWWGWVGHFILSHSHTHKSINYYCLIYTVLQKRTYHKQ